MTKKKVQSTEPAQEMKELLEAEEAPMEAEVAEDTPVFTAEQQAQLESAMAPIIGQIVDKVTAAMPRQTQIQDAMAPIVGQITENITAAMPQMETMMDEIKTAVSSLNETIEKSAKKTTTAMWVAGGLIATALVAGGALYLRSQANKAGFDGDMVDVSL